MRWKGRLRWFGLTMKRNFEGRVARLEGILNPPPRQIATLRDFVVWAAEKPLDENVEFAPWINELINGRLGIGEDEERP